MKIAVALFGTRVSPRFEFAPDFLLVEQKDGQFVLRERIPVRHWPPVERASHLTALGVNVVICGGISRFLAGQLYSRGIRVYSWISGEVEHALQCLLAGELESGVMAGPGGACGRWRFGRGGGRGRGGGGWRAANGRGPGGGARGGGRGGGRGRGPVW